MSKSKYSVKDPFLGEIPKELLILDDDYSESDNSELPTLSNVGRVLPIGFIDQSGNKHRDFKLIDWNWDVEEKLGEIAENNPNMSMTEYISEIVCNCISNIGELDLVKMKRSHKRLLLRNMYYSDVLYMYIWIRINALGNKIKFDSFNCSECNKKIENFVGDLYSLEVKCFDEIPSKVVELEYGIKYSGEKRKKIKIGPIHWSFLEGENNSIFSNPAKFKFKTIQNAIVEIIGAPTNYITSDHLRTMKIFEINKLILEIDQCGGGAVMEVRDKCYHCKRVFSQTIDWSYQNFFGHSSH